MSISHEEKVTLSVVGIGAVALIVYLATRGPSPSVSAGGQIVPIGGGTSPDVINLPNAPGGGDIVLPDLGAPGIVNGGVPYFGSGPLPAAPNLTATNPYASQCTCAGVGLNQIYYADVPALVAAQAPAAAPAPAPSGGGGVIAALKQAASYFTIPPASTVGIPAGGAPVIPVSEGLSYV